jgi:hypothetical protein
MPYPHRDCSEYQHEEFRRDHHEFTPGMAISGCPRCMSDWLRQLDRLDPETPKPTAMDLTSMNGAINHTLDGYWKGRRSEVLNELWKYSAAAGQDADVAAQEERVE